MPVKLSVGSQYFEALSWLQENERDAAFKALYRFCERPDWPGLNLEKIADPFWTIRVNKDIRVVLRKPDENSWIACWVGHHDVAYQWIANHKRTVSQPDQEQEKPYEIADDSDLNLIHWATYPWDNWMMFLHPEQWEWVKKNFSGPALVHGPPGTGKTVVLIHRAKRLAEEGARVLVMTYTSALCTKIRQLLGDYLSKKGRSDVSQHITVETVFSAAVDIVRSKSNNWRPLTSTDTQKKARDFFKGRGGGQPHTTPDFLRAEFEKVIERQGISSWDEYQEVERSGRSHPLKARERYPIWGIFQEFYEMMERKNLLTPSRLMLKAAQILRDDPLITLKHDAVLVDEVQDLSVPELRFVSAMADACEGRVMLAGDGVQRIYRQSGVSLKQVGIDVRGRSKVLRKNYRCSKVIYEHAHRVLGEVSDEEDSLIASRTHIEHSYDSGTAPTYKGFQSPEAETAWVCEEVTRLLSQENYEGKSIGIFARTNEDVRRFESALKKTGVKTGTLSDKQICDGVQLGTLHKAKGFEFRAVFICAASSAMIPNEEALKGCETPEERCDTEKREKQLLYVAMTRARDRLYVTWTGEPSPFLEPVLS